VLALIYLLSYHLRGAHTLWNGSISYSPFLCKSAVYVAHGTCLALPTRVTNHHAIYYNIRWLSVRTLGYRSGEGYVW